MAWEQYHFVSSVFPQTYSISPKGDPFVELESIQVNSINEYMKMIRGLNPGAKFRRVKAGNLGWDIKREVFE